VIGSGGRWLTGDKLLSNVGKYVKYVTFKVERVWELRTNGMCMNSTVDETPNSGGHEGGVVVGEVVKHGGDDGDARVREVNSEEYRGRVG